MRRILFLATAVLAIGCGGGESKTEIVPLDKVPETVMKAAKEKLPDVTFEEAWKKPNGDYEIRGKNKQGKVREVELKPTGEVTEVE